MRCATRRMPLRESSRSRRRGEKRDDASSHEAQPHHWNDLHRESATGDDPCSVEEQPYAGNRLEQTRPVENEGQQRANYHGWRETEDELAPRARQRGIFARRDFRTIAHTMMSGDNSAEASQTLIVPPAVGDIEATTETTTASTPIPTIPHPETAVNAPAASMVLRMNARLSIARPWSDESSFGGGGRSGRTDVMRIS